MIACFAALGVPLPSPVPGMEADLDFAGPEGDGPLVSAALWIGTCGCMAPLGGISVAMRISFCAGIRLLTVDPGYRCALPAH